MDEIERMSQFNPEEADSDDQKTVAVLRQSVMGGR